VPRRSLVRAPRRSLGRAPKRSLGRVRGWSLGRVRGRSLCRAPRRSLGRARGRSLGRVRGWSLGRVRGWSLGRAPRRSLGRARGRSLGRAPRRQDMTYKVCYGNHSVLITAHRSTSKMADKASMVSVMVIGALRSMMRVFGPIHDLNASVESDIQASRNEYSSVFESVEEQEFCVHTYSPSREFKEMFRSSLYV